MQERQLFLASPEYQSFLARKEKEPLHVSFFQKRICSCMVDEKMTQCADSIDTQFNVLFATWKKWVFDHVTSHHVTSHHVTSRHLTPHLALTHHRSSPQPQSRIHDFRSDVADVFPVS